MLRAVLLETGMIEMREPETVVRLEAPGGVVEVRAAGRDGRCESVELTNVACFADRLDAAIEVEGIGTVTVDVAYGGMWYAIADARALGFAIEPHEARDLSLAGERIRAAVREQLPVRASGEPGDLGRQQRADRRAVAGDRQRERERRRRRARTAGSLRDGTGLSARMAVRHARGQLGIGDAMTHAFAIGSTCEGRIVAETRVGDRTTILPAIRGSAWITGVSQLHLDPADPFPEGYVLPGTFGVSGLDTQA